MIATALSDAELLEAARGGDESAFTELYVRHQAAARRLALSYRRASDPDDLVNEAFEKVLSILRRGGGPTESFRAYLFVTLRRIATDTIERSRDDPYDEVPEPVREEERGRGLDAAERQIVLQAFESLPERWQAVLWQTTVEGHTPQELAPSMGMTANATAALAYRAREKLRQAYLQAHLQAAPRPQCEPFRSQLGAHVRDGLSTRDRTKVDNHLGQCAACQDLRAELLNINALLNQALVPYFAVVGEDVAALILGTSGGGALIGGPVTLARKGYSKARNNPGPAVAVAALAVALAVGLISNLGSNGSARAPDAAAGPVEEANQAAPGSSSTPSTGDSPDAADPDDPDVADEDAEVEADDGNEPATTDPDGSGPADTPASAAGPGSDPTAPGGTSPSTDTSAGPAPDVPAPADPPPGSTAPTDPPPTDPPPTTAPASPSGVVVWNEGADRVEVTLHNPGPQPTEPMLMNISLRGGALTSGLPSGCTGVPLLVRTECLVGAIPAGGSRTVTQPVTNAGPSTSASVSCTLGFLGLACSDVLSPSSTALG